MVAKVRQYELYIGENPELITLLKQPNVNLASGSKPISDTRTIPVKNSVTLITTLQMVAEIVQNREGSLITQTGHLIQVFNTTPDQERYMRVGNTIILRAGYDTDSSLPLIMAAQIVQVNIKKSKDGSRCAKIICGEAYQQREKVRFTTSYDKTLTYGNVINDLLNKFALYGVPTGTIELNPVAEEKQLSVAYAVSGNLVVTLNDILKNTGHRWYLSSGAIYVEPISKTSIESTALYDLLPSAIKNTIELSDSAVNKTVSEQEVRTQGIRVETDLNGSLNENDGINVLQDTTAKDDPNFTTGFASFAGTYKITHLVHRLNFRGRDWSSFITAKD